jgi:hypothetical protein
MGAAPPLLSGSSIHSLFPIRHYASTSELIWSVFVCPPLLPPRPHGNRLANPNFSFTERVFSWRVSRSYLRSQFLPPTYYTWIAFAFDASNLHRDIRLPPFLEPSLILPFLQRSLSPPPPPFLVQSTTQNANRYRILSNSSCVRMRRAGVVCADIHKPLRSFFPFFVPRTAITYCSCVKLSPHSFFYPVVLL